MILKCNFAKIYAFHWTKVEQHFIIVFFHFTAFKFKNAEINFLKRIRVLNAVFIKFLCRWLQNGPADLKNTTKHMKFAYDRYFTNRLKYSFLEDFENHQQDHCMCNFHLNTCSKFPKS